MKILGFLRYLAFVAMPLYWLAYMWERFTGLTFVTGRRGNLNVIGEISSPEHLHHTLAVGIVVTLVSIPIILLTRPKATDDSI